MIRTKRILLALIFVLRGVSARAQSTSDLDNIEAWISNQFASSDSAPIPIEFNYEVPNQGAYQLIQSLRGRVQLTSFSLKSCRLEMTTTGVLTIIQQTWDHDRRNPDKKIDESWNASQSADLKDMQPSLVTLTNVDYTLGSVMSGAQCSVPSPVVE